MISFQILIDWSSKCNACSSKCDAYRGIGLNNQLELDVSSRCPPLGLYSRGYIYMIPTWDIELNMTSTADKV